MSSLSQKPPMDGDPDHLWQDAIEAVMRVKAMPAGPAAEREAQRWRGQSPRHAEAWTEAERVWQVAAALPPMPSAPLTSVSTASVSTASARPRRSPLPSRRMVLGGAGALAAGTAALLLAPAAFHRLRGDTVSGTAELRDLDLPDGSRMILGPESVVRVAVTGTERRIDMLDGMAFLQVRPDPGRPFVARAGDLTVTVVGTAFELRRTNGLASVSVTQGRVRAESPDLPQPILLGPGDRLTAKAEGGVEQGRAAADQVAAWRDGTLVVDRRPIADVAADLERWYAGRILVLDGAFGRRPVSGVFQLDQPEAALRAAVRPYGGRVRSIAGRLLLVDMG